MGVTVDLIPRLPDESPEQAIARIYEDGIAIVYDPESATMRMELIEDGDSVEKAPPGAFAGWRAEVLSRLHDLHEWQSELIDGHPHLWSAHFLWQVEFGDHDITLRHRRDHDGLTLDDEDFLAAFEGLRTILHWPDQYGTYSDLDDPFDRPTTIG